MDDTTASQADAAGTAAPANGGAAGAAPADAVPRLTSLSHGAGCACKLSLDELTEILEGVSFPDDPDLLVGATTGDDAAVYRQPDGRVLVATTDFFTPLVDDASTWGRIAAANAVSDVYAMGATPRFALNLVGWPRDLPFSVLEQVLVGASEIAAEAGYLVAGGHSIDSVEPLFGQVVIGDTTEDAVLTNAGATPGPSAGRDQHSVDPGDPDLGTVAVGAGRLLRGARSHDVAGPVDLPGTAGACDRRGGRRRGGDAAVPLTCVAGRRRRYRCGRYRRGCCR